MSSRLKQLIGSSLMATAGLLASAAPANAGILPGADGQFVWTELAWKDGPCNPTFNGRPCALGSIDSLAGQRIRIVRLGIGGDADVASGDTGFRLQGGGLEFSWTAGQVRTNATYDLGATPGTSGISRGFVYSPVLELTALEGASLTISWDYHNDFDGRYTVATDALGNVFNDIAYASSVRPWIQFERLGPLNALPEKVPEPASAAVFGLGMLALALGRRQRRSSAKTN